MAEIVMITCDYLVRGTPCGEPAETYSITRRQETLLVDLCDKHAADWWGRVEEIGRPAVVGKGRRARGVAAHRKSFDPNA